MQSFFYWADWSRPYKALYSLLFTQLLAVLVWMAYSYSQGYEVYLDWQKQGQAETTDVKINTIKVGPFNITNTAENTTYTQRFSSSGPKTNAASYYVFLGITTICACLLITIISTLPRFSFYIGAAFIVLYFMNMKLELLYLFGSEQKMGLALSLILFLPTAFYFNRIKSHITFFSRLLTFTCLFLISGVVVFFGANVERPFLHVSAASLLNPLIISLVFTLLIAHEIMGAVVLLLTRSNASSSKNTLTHFCIITLIYLANLVLAYLCESNIISWDIVYIHPFLLLTVSTLLGIWLYKYRESQYSYLFSFSPLGALFFIALAVCCFTTLTHLHTTANDPGIEIFRDFVIYGHLAYSFIFLLYIVANFINPLKNNMKVYKVLYTPATMPYFTYRIAGLIAFIALIAKSNWQVPVNQGISAYYNSLGDLHLKNQEGLLAESYFEEAAIYGYNNHKSNFALATFLESKKEHERAAIKYKDALAKWPSEQAYVNLGNLYLDDGRFFDALFVLKEAGITFPNSIPIHNNLALLYGKTGLLDSAVYHLDRAYGQSENETAASNILAVVARSDFKMDADSVLAYYQVKDDPISVNNNYVLYSNSGKPLEHSYTTTDTTLNFLDASILFNRSFNRLFSVDSLETQTIFDLANKPGNASAREQLKYVACLNLYKNKNVNKAFRELNWLANESTSKGGEFFNVIGTWALEQNAWEVAADYFKWATDKDWPEAPFNRAIALSEGGNLIDAIATWQEIATGKDQEAKQIATTMLTILTADLSSIEALPDYQKYLFVRYRFSHRDTTKFTALAESFQDMNYRGQACLDMCQKLWKHDQTEAAIRLYRDLGDLQITDEDLYRETQWFELKMLASEKNIRQLAQKINQGVEFDRDHILEKHFYTGLLNEASEDTATARQNYELIAYMNPFFEEAVIHSANFFSLMDPFEAYNILLNALEVNPNSIKLLKAYILQCARVELNSYADNSLEDLKRLIPQSDFTVFRDRYEALVVEMVEAHENL